jgi:hypothetical protein
MLVVPIEDNNLHPSLTLSRNKNKKNREINIQWPVLFDSVTPIAKHKLVLTAQIYNWAINFWRNDRLRATQMFAKSYSCLDIEYRCRFHYTFHNHI